MKDRKENGSDAEFGRFLFDETPEPLWLIRTPDLQILESNRAATQRFGFTREQFLGMALTDILSDGDIERLRHAMRERDPLSADLRGLKTRQAHGSPIDTDLSVRFLKIDGAPSALVCALDMTARKILEERVRQAGKMEAIGMLAGGIAHDFNNLLTIISGYSQLLVNVVPDSDRSSIEQILRASERAAELTGQLLTFSRRQELQPQALDLNRIVSGMSTMLRRLIGEHIELRLALAPDLGAIHADPGHIDQIVMNLAVNARDAMAHGGQLVIETSNVKLGPERAERSFGVRPGDYVMLSVRDTGVGMDQKTRARVFDPFFTTKEKGRGTGLGLSTVYTIVKQAGGTVEILSEVEQGTAVNVLFPRIGDAVPASTRKAKAPAKSVKDDGGRGEKILVIEDEEAVRRLVRATLEQRGYRVLVASGGAEALNLIGEVADIDIVIADLVLPAMSGVEVADEIRKMRPAIRVLYMSGYTDRSLQRTESLPRGAVFLQKPFTPEMLAKCVREALDRGDGGGNRAMSSNP